MKPRIIPLLVVISLCSNALAADVSWDISNAAGITGGTGVWSNFSQTWTTDGGATNIAWSNGTNAADTALFSGTAGTVTLANPISAAGIKSTITGYTVAGSFLGFGANAGVIDTTALPAAGVTTISTSLGGTSGLTIAGNGDLTANGGSSSGLVTLSGINTDLSGGIAITSGLVNTGSAASFGSYSSVAGSGNTLTLSNGSGLVTATPAANILYPLGNNIVFSGATNATLRSYGTRFLVLNGQISGTTGLNVTDAGTLQLTNASNSFTGPISVLNGALNARTIGSIGVGTSALGAPATAANGTITLGSATLTAGLIYSGSGETTDRILNFAGTTGPVSLTQSGYGQLVFSSAPAFTGAGAKTLTLTGSTVGRGEISGAIADSGGGATSVTKTGTGRWTLSGNNTYTGATTISAGTLSLTGSNTSAISVAAGATLTGSGSTTGTVTLASGSNLLVGSGFIHSNGVTPAAVNLIARAGSVTMGANTLDVIGYGSGGAPAVQDFIATAYRGGLVSDDNLNQKLTLSFTAAARTWNGTSSTWDLGTTPAWVEGDTAFYSGDAVTFPDIPGDTVVTLGATVAPSAIAVTNNNAVNYTLSGSGSITGTTTLTKSGSGSLTLSTSNSYTGATTVSNGLLSAAATNAFGTGALSLTGGNLGLVANAAITIPNTITGSGGIAVTGTAQASLGGDLSGFAGTIDINTTGAGKLALTPAGAGGLPSSAVVNVNNATTCYLNGTGNYANTFYLLGTSNTENFGALRVDAGTIVSGSVVLGANSSIGAVSGTGEISGIISEVGGSRSLTKQGAGTIVLSGANSYSGNTTITSGTLSLANASAVPSTGSLTFSSATATGILGTLNVGSYSPQFTGLTVNYNPNSTTSATAVVAGPGTLTIQGSSDFSVVNNSSNTPQGSAYPVTLDMTNLRNFVYNSASNKVLISGNGNARSSTVTMGVNSTFTASSFEFQNGGAGGNTAKTNFVNLGVNTTINANTLMVLNNNNKDSATFQFRTGLVKPVLTVRATNGTDRAAWNVGTALTGTGTALVDLTTGVTGGSQLDALVGTLQIGQKTAGANTANANFLMGGGTLDATSINLGNLTITGGTLNANLTVTGGTVKVGTLTMGTQTLGTLNSNFNLNGGANLAAQTIQNGTGTGTRNLNWNDGTITTFDAATDLTIGSPIKLAATGTHTFNIPVDRTATVSGVIAEAAAGGAITKTGDGKVILSATNTYTGDTLINGGTLSLGAASLADTADVRITNGAVLELTHAAMDTIDELYIDGVQQSTGIWGSLASSAPHKTDRITGTGLLRVTTGVATDPYADWIVITGLTDGVNSAKDLDPDNDGRINFQEYALDGNPLSGVRSGKVVGKVATLTINATQQKVLTLTLPVRATPAFSGTTEQVSDVAEGVIYHIQSSADLNDWTSIPVLEVPADQKSALQTSLALPSITAGFTYRSFYIPGSDPALSPKLFMRAKVVESP